MVEFGAGGNITQPAEPPADGDNEVGTPGAAGGGVTPATPAPPVATQRRKRKAKGWFCPVCRQREFSFAELCLLWGTKNSIYLISVHFDVTIDDCSPSSFGEQGRR